MLVLEIPPPPPPPPPPLPGVLTLSDLIEKTARYLVPSQRDLLVQLALPITAGDETINLAGAAIKSLSVGALLAIDLEVFYVLGFDPNDGIATVVPGFQGSVPENHVEGSLVAIDPKFSKFDIAVAINDDLLDLSSPSNGVVGIKTTSIVFNPTYMGYDLSALGPDFIDVLEVRYRIPYPTHNFPLIGNRKWAIGRNLIDPIFPSGNAIFLYEDAYPGMPFHITYAAPLSQMTQLSDEVVSVTGLPPTAVDLPPLGAAVRLGDAREVKRNFIESQPDARKAVEVPAGAVGNSFKWAEQRRMKRIDAEADRIKRQYPRLRSY